MSYASFLGRISCMRVETGEILEKKCDAILVPSSAYLTYNGLHHVAFFDEGISSTIANLYPSIRAILADKINKTGNFVFVLTASTESCYAYKPFLSGYQSPSYHLINFPTKPGKAYLSEFKNDILLRYKKKLVGTESIPGYMVAPNKGIIEESVKETIELVNKTNWTRILVPSFDQEDLNTFLDSTLDDRFVLVKRK